MVPQVSVVPAGTAADAAFVAEVVDLVNRVYADAEKGLWQQDTHRTDADEVMEYIRTGQLTIARMDGRLVGAVRIQHLDDDLGGFGMLVASPEHRGVGVGRVLVAFAEDWARARGLGRMQLELLVPQTWPHPVKEFLREWYTRIGYRHVRIGDFAVDYPALEPLLATPCDFQIFHKPLSLRSL